jgi:hypothetical protein
MHEMRSSDLSRRRFHKLSMAALGGLVAGTGSSALAQDKEGDKPKVNVDPALLLSEPHVCRGLNTCDGKGKGDHACAGQGACSAVDAYACAGENDCKGQGGCGGYPGQNICQGKGKCAVPLKEEVWKLARKQFEQLMKDAGKKVGPAPKKG